MMTEDKRMKILKIDSGKAFFYSFKIKQYMEIDKIDREALFSLTEFIMNNTQFMMDEFVDENINNNAQKIVYKNIYAKLSELVDRKDSIVREIDNKYKSALDEYK